MARNSRVVEPGLPYHVTQRGSNRQNVFFTVQDRQTYLTLLRKNMEDAEVRILSYCLMTNHLHLVVVPEKTDSLATLFRRVHGGYAQYLNARSGRSGHVWQNRYYSCPMSDTHLWLGIRYVETNPVRDGLAGRPEDYRWSSAKSHLEAARDESGVLDHQFWLESGGLKRWQLLHTDAQRDAQVHLLRRCTYAGRPFGEEEFVRKIEDKFHRKWRRWSFEQGYSGRMLTV